MCLCSISSMLWKYLSCSYFDVDIGSLRGVICRFLVATQSSKRPPSSPSILISVHFVFMPQIYSLLDHRSPQSSSYSFAHTHTHCRSQVLTTPISCFILSIWLRAAQNNVLSQLMCCCSSECIRKELTYSWQHGFQCCYSSQVPVWCLHCTDLFAM